jgi:hypothetical protein
MQVAQMHALADATKEAGVKHVVFSSLDASTKILEEKGITSIPKIGKFCVPHFDTKGMAQLCMFLCFVRTRVYACMHIYAYVCVCTYVCVPHHDTNAWHSYTYFCHCFCALCVLVYMHACIYVCMHLCVCSSLIVTQAHGTVMHVSVLSVHLCICMYTHLHLQYTHQTCSMILPLAICYHISTHNSYIYIYLHI